MLIIDIREACKEQRTGKGQWSLGLVTELLHRAVPLTLLSDRLLPASLTSLLRPEHEVVVFDLKGLAWHHRVHRFLLQRTGDTYVSTTSYLLPAFSSAPVHFCTVVHDLIAFRKEPHDRRAQFIERFSLGRALKRSSTILSVSETTKRDLLKKFSTLTPAMIYPVYAGSSFSVVPQRVPNGNMILCLATLCPRKNQLRLLQAYAVLPQELRAKTELMLAGGRGWDDDGIIALASSTEGARWIGHVSDEEMRRLFASCSMFAYPSLYEGFGLPVLDALQTGIPVLTSTQGSLEEVVGDSALTVDPLSIDSIEKGMERLLTDEALRTELSNKGPKRAALYSWKRTANLVLDALSIDKIA